MSSPLWFMCYSTSSTTPATLGTLAKASVETGPDSTLTHHCRAVHASMCAKNQCLYECHSMSGHQVTRHLNVASP